MNPIRAIATWAAAGAMICLGTQATADSENSEKYFRRIATFPVYLNTDINLETVAEIVDVSKNGQTLVYTDSEQELVGFVDISNAYQPAADGTVAVGGEPTSVAVAGKYALTAVNTSDNFVDTSGHLRVINMNTRAVIRDIPLGGQPDSISVSPDGRYAAIAIENERDEDLGDGRPPQHPPGFLVIVDLVGNPGQWSTRKVDLVGVADKFPLDPEPEYVDINANNIAAVTMQENNHIVLVNLQNGTVIGDFPAGAVNLNRVDTNENDLIELQDRLTNVPREPDGLVWINPDLFATADEGDLDGGSRGFSIFDTSGNVGFTSGNRNDHITVRLGHYPENRSENKGNEPENVEYARFGSSGQFLFVGSERSSLVFVYRLQHGNKPQLHQVLPAGLGPEGLKAIPGRDLFVAASEQDSRDDKFRSALTIYKLKNTRRYPTLQSAYRADGTPIPWGALSALAYSHGHDGIYSVYDSFYRKSRIFRIEAPERHGRITDEIVLIDASDVLKNTHSVEFVEDELTRRINLGDLVNEDNTVNLDPEGLTISQDGLGFWLASEGNGNLVKGVNDPDNRPFNWPNLLLRIAYDGSIEQVVQLPSALERNQLRFGFEGVASVQENGAEVLYAAFQREWSAAGDPDGFVRIGRYDTVSGDWSFAYYQLDEPTSPNGGWVGLSEIVHLQGQQFAVIERDNQAGSDARIKRIYRFSIAGMDFRKNPDAGAADNVIAADEKILARDLIADGDLTRLNGQIIEKVEGLAALPSGAAVIVTDNDGTDDSRGETQFLKIGDVF